MNWHRQSWDTVHFASFDELNVIIPYFTAVFILSNAVEHKFVSLTNSFVAAGKCIHTSVDFNIASKTLL
jgi:hypothetical protein